MTLNKEAATIISVLAALVTEVVGLLVTFGIDVSDAQRNAIIGTLTAMTGVIMVLGPIIRQFVYSKHTVDTISQQKYAQGLDDGNPLKV